MLHNLFNKHLADDEMAVWLLHVKENDDQLIKESRKSGSFRRLKTVRDHIKTNPAENKHKANSCDDHNTCKVCHR